MKYKLLMSEATKHGVRDYVETAGSLFHYMEQRWRIVKSYSDAPDEDREYWVNYAILNEELALAIKLKGVPVEQHNEV